MFKRVVTVMAFALVGLGLLGTACKKDEDKFCESMRKLEGTYSDEECKKDIEGIKAECSNADEVISCGAGAGSEEAMEACEAKCKDKE